MKLSQLFSIYPHLRWGEQAITEVAGLCCDSRLISRGQVFVAIRGLAFDGHEVLPAICQAGAIGVVVESDAKVPTDYNGAVVVVSDTRRELNRLANRFYGEATDSLFCVGVTGTNGKTTVTHAVEHVLNEFGWQTGVIGTIDHHLGERVWQTDLTTPDTLTFHKRLAEFRSLGAQAVAMEVSSHALAQQRVEALAFDAVVFTNLTRDHLDYHGDMERYFASKQRLFREVLASSTKPHQFAIVNHDDAYGRKLQVDERARRWTYGQREADFSFRILGQDFEGSRVAIKGPSGKGEIRIPLVGLFNVYNCVAALACGVAAGVSMDRGLQALQSFRGVRGRLQRVGNSRGIHAFVDYAHTDDALNNVLSSLRQVRDGMKSQSRIITVFGCGGDRDRGKRPLMGGVASGLSDLVFVTSDNPRSEEPTAIVDDIMTGIPSELRDHTVFVEVDRRTAIARAASMAREEDILLVAGKGHEDYQIIGKDRQPFADVDVIKEVLG